MSSAGDDFHANELDTIENVIGLSPRDPLNGFAGMFLYKITMPYKIIIIINNLSPVLTIDIVYLLY